MKIKKLVILIFIILTQSGIAQQIYQVGVSQKNIEPHGDLMAITLAGYAIPWEGRFPLQWIEKDHIPAVTDIKGSSQLLYILKNDSIFYNDPNIQMNITPWKFLTEVKNIKAFSPAAEYIYAIDNNRNLLRYNPKEIKPHWDIISKDLKDTKLLTSTNDHIIVANTGGSFWISKTNNKKISWNKIDLELDSIVDIAAYDKFLYALTENGKLYRKQITVRDDNWQLISYKNNITVGQNIKQIAISDNTIFALDDQHKLYEGEYRSKNELTARSIAVKNENEVVVIVGVDITGMNDTFTKYVKEQIYENTGLQPSSVFINASHTHFAPITQAWLPWQEPNRYPDSLYLYSIVGEGIIASVTEALKNIKPARLYFGRGSTAIGYNRSLEDHPELYDNHVDVIKVEYLDEAKSNYLFIAACHPVFSAKGKVNYTLSANFPGVTRRLLEEKTGTVNSIFLQGAAGDINPVDDDEYITGNKLANDIYSIIYKSIDKISGPILHSLDTIDIPIQIKTKKDILEFKDQNLQIDDDSLEIKRNINWSNLMLQYYEQDVMPEFMSVYIHTLNIGDWKLVGFSREATSEYSLRTKSIWPNDQVSVTGYTNDVSSYLPTTKHIEAENYEGYGSFLWYGVPNTFPIGVEDTIIEFIKKNHAE